MSDTQAKATPGPDEARGVWESSQRDKNAELVGKLLGALKRLGSAEGFTAIGVIPDNSWGDEIKARIDFARAAIKAAEEK